MSLLDLLFPPHCLGCQKTGQYFCPQCLTKIKRVQQICPVCERPSPFGKTHQSCQTKYSLDGLVSFFLYGGIIREAIHKLKYRRVTDLKKELFALMEKETRSRSEEFLIFWRFLKEKSPTVIPIPLFWYKERERGFNQAGLLAKALACGNNLPFSDKILTREKMTPTQTKLNPKQRLENVKDAFAVSPNCQLLIANCLIVDDVWTTGATLKTAANLLKRNEVKDVWGLTIAR